MPRAVKTILVVEDNQDLRDMLMGLIEAGGYRTVGAANGRDALTAFDRGTIDAVLLDLNMPVMSGWDVLAEMSLRFDLRSIPVIVLTAVMPARFPSRVLVGIEKPVEPDVLFAALRRAVGRPARPAAADG